MANGADSCVGRWRGQDAVGKGVQADTSPSDSANGEREFEAGHGTRAWWLRRMWERFVGGRGASRLRNP